MGALTTRFDLKLYARLLSKVTPRVITNRAEHERALAAVEALMEKGEQGMSPEEDAVLDLLTTLIETYEKSIYPPFEKSAPNEMVAFLMEQRGLSPKDLWPVLGSASRVSEILSGKRSISKDQAKKLSAFFHTGVEIFI